MRMIAISFGVMALLVSVAYADTIVQVDAWATWNATQPCLSNCTQQISVSFLYDMTIYQTPIPADYPANAASWPYPMSSQVVPGSLTVTSSGFLGTFLGSGVVNLWNTATDGHMAFLNPEGDEIDLWVAHNDQSYPSVTNPFPIGINTIGFTGWSCNSRSCVDQLGVGGFFLRSPDSELTIVKPVSVDEPSALTMLLMVGISVLYFQRHKRLPKRNNGLYLA